MNYHLLETDSGLSEGFRRIAIELVEKADAELRDQTLPDKRRVHQLRKRMKMLRGLVRLVRPSFAKYRAENVAFRDAGRSLSGLRDADVLIATYDAVCANLPAGADRRRFSAIRQVLTWRSKAIWASIEMPDRFEAYARAGEAAWRRIPDWQLSETGLDAAAGGLVKTYRRARRAMRAARSDQSEPVMHEWRKRAKYHWYHARLLKPLSPEIIGPHAEKVGVLSETLGDHHDLSVLDALLDALAHRARSADIPAFRHHLGARQLELEKRAFALGRELLSDTPAELVARWRPLWEGWPSTAKEGLLQARA